MADLKGKSAFDLGRFDDQFEIELMNHEPKEVTVIVNDAAFAIVVQNLIEAAGYKLTDQGVLLGTGITMHFLK
jgi:hypothetical protein